MSDINYNNITAQSIATMAIKHVNDQKRIDHVCTLAFAGKTYVAPEDSILYGAVAILAKKADEFRKAKAAGKVDKTERFNAINMLSTMVARWLKKQSRFEGRRVSIQSMKAIKVALVERKDNNHKAKPKAKGKGAKDSAIKGVKDLAGLIDYAIDAYGLPAVIAELGKRVQEDKEEKRAA